MVQLTEKTLSFFANVLLQAALDKTIRMIKFPPRLPSDSAINCVDWHLAILAPWLVRVDIPSIRTKKINLNPEWTSTERDFQRNILPLGDFSSPFWKSSGQINDRRKVRACCCDEIVIFQLPSARNVLLNSCRQSGSVRDSPILISPFVRN